MTLNDHEKSMLRHKYEQYCHENRISSDLFDFDAELDSSLEYWEAWGEIEEKVSKMLEVQLGINRQEAKELQKEEAVANLNSSNSILNVDNNRPLAILGLPHTGKTNLMVFLARHSNRKKYILGYPKKIAGFTQLSTMQDLTLISDCVLCIDEISKFIRIYDNRANMALIELIQFAEHNRIKLIFTTQLSQFVTKMMEAMVGQWAITKIDLFGLKNGSKPKRILVDNLALPSIVSKQTGMKLLPGNFIWWNDDAVAGENGLKSFPNQGIAKDWGRNPDKKPDKNQSKNPEYRFGADKR